MSFSNYIRELQQYGKCCFSIEEAVLRMGKSRKAVLSSIEHLLARGEIASPARGFYVIVAPEYQKLGCIPAEHFIPYLMQYWNSSYYAGLLSAASYHGASHQAVQNFQVMIEGRHPELHCGRVRVRFMTNQHLKEIPVQRISTSKSILNVSTPEGTAKDLMYYLGQSGGLNHIVTVLEELQEVIDRQKLSSLAESSKEVAWKQRLGFLFEHVGARGLAEVLRMHLVKLKRVDYILLMPGKKGINKYYPRNNDWKIIENITLENDL
ncbi:MAG: type IV toxin-antitoxin system AbiEi family antitoxin [Gammaproteobacteria bacterium]|nr:type IV toxin-antitoxin system AbiEi family antitoxin [Gammaproteobacteria bacterium]